MQLPVAVRGTRPSLRLVGLQVIVWLPAVLLAAWFIGQAGKSSAYTMNEMVKEYKGTEPRVVPSDFPMFYAGARLARTDPAHLYEKPAMVREIFTVQGRPLPEGAEIDPQSPQNQWLRYYNPPSYLFAFSPLTHLGLKDAYLVATAVNVAFLAALLVLMGFVLRWRQPHTLLVQLGVLSLTPTYFALFHGQPSVLLAALMCAGYLAMRSGRSLLAGVLLSLLAIKPHCLLTATPLLRKPRLTAGLVAGGLVIFLIPSLLVAGAEGMLGYVRLMLDRGDGDLNNPVYGVALLSWPGFFRALTGEQEPLPWLVASLATLLLLAFVWWRGRRGVAFAASIPALLLVVPHSHSQDWALMAAAAAVLLSLRWTPVAYTGIAGGLLAVVWGANDWPGAHWRAFMGGHAVYWVTLAAFGLLVWLSLMTMLRSGGVDDSEEASAVSG